MREAGRQDPTPSPGAGRAHLVNLRSATTLDKGFDGENMLLADVDPGLRCGPSERCYRRRRSTNCRGVHTVTPSSPFFGTKCRVFPVTIASAPPAIATSTTSRSSGSGSERRSGRESTGWLRRASTSSKTRRSMGGKPNRGRDVTSSYSAIIRESVSRIASPCSTSCSARSGVPPPVSIADTTTFVSKTTRRCARITQTRPD